MIEPLKLVEDDAEAKKLGFKHGPFHLLERDFELHVEHERFRGLRTIEDVAHHARAFVELDHGDGVGRRKTGRGGPVIDHIAVELALAAGLEHTDLA